jgi:hypothetical protein
VTDAQGGSTTRQRVQSAKICTRCGLRAAWKLLSHCKVCRNGYPSFQKEYRKRYIRSKRVETANAVNSLKSAPCVDCGRSFPPFCMEFDHIDPSKKCNDIKNLVCKGRSFNFVLKEIEKCHLVCILCHRMRTYNAQQSLRTATSGNRQSKRNTKFIHELKRNPCVDCGKIFHPCHMDFDHLTSDKIAKVSNLRQKSKSVILAEIAKTELVCALCHRIRTHKRRSQGVSA